MAEAKNEVFVEEQRETLGIIIKLQNFLYPVISFPLEKRLLKFLKGQRGDWVINKYQGEIHSGHNAG